MARTPLAARLPDFPWDSLAAAKQLAGNHPDGIVDLSVGTPVDPTPQVAQQALQEAANSPGYPTTIGTQQLRAAIVGEMSTRWQARGLSENGVLPVIGTKELVAWLPLLLGLGGPGSTGAEVVMFPAVAYPTYAVGAQIAGCTLVADDGVEAIRRHRPALVWLNSPANPTGAVLAEEELRAQVAAAREVGAIVVSDECYGEFGWEAEPVSVLDPRVCGGSHDSVLAVHSLSKRSNLAGFRAGWVAGDEALITELAQARKHAGMIVPGPVQHTMTRLLADRDHVDAQRARYAARRTILRSALEQAGFTVDHSQAGLYLWVTRGEDCRASVNFFAERGILVAPGDFYGADAAQHVRVALTATDERVNAAAARLS